MYKRQVLDDAILANLLQATTLCTYARYEEEVVRSHLADVFEHLAPVSYTHLGSEEGTRNLVPLQAVFCQGG